MNYKLAKQLKDTGFPQPKDALAKNSDRLFCPHPDEKCICKDKYFVFFPILSELIEACGDKFALHMRPENKGWTAWRINPNLQEQAHDIQEHGMSPEEAVAKLWLALNKKDEQ